MESDLACPGTAFGTAAHFINTLSELAARPLTRRWYQLKARGLRRW
jgi:hypothetical protein